MKVLCCLVMLMGVLGLEVREDVIQREEPPEIIGDPDGNLNIYVLPVGQGDGHVIQCPNGDLTILDLGTRSAAAKPYWKAANVRTFLRLDGGDAATWLSRIKNIIITHDDQDHHKFFPGTFPALPGLLNMYVSCKTTTHYQNSELKAWIASINKVKIFNKGLPCGPNSPQGSRPLCVPHDPSKEPNGDNRLNICPDENIDVRVIGANLGGCAGTTTKNTDSIVLHINVSSSTAGIKILMTGDFEDSSPTSDGVLKQMVDSYGATLESTVYKLSHHGTWVQANKKIFIDVVKPKAIFVSSDPEISNSGKYHPNCGLITYLCNGGSSSIPNYCTGSTQSDIQSQYVCGEADAPIQTANTDKAIYTTVSSIVTNAHKKNLITLTVNRAGTEWQINSNLV